MEENIVIYDWLSFTTKKHTAEEIIDILGLGLCPFELVKGARGYRDRFYFGSISVHFNGRHDMGVWVEMSGQGCRTFETCSVLGWDNLFKIINIEELKITRLDIAFDDHTGVLDINQIFQDTVNQYFISRSEYWECITSSKGISIMHGSPSSLVRFRIYDKARERNYDTSVHWVRIEMQLRDERAINFSKLFDNPMVTIGDAFSGVLLNYLRYVVPDPEDSNKWRWDMQPYWLDLLSFLTPIKIYTSPGIDYNLDNLNRYVFNQAGNAIDTAIKIHGLDEFLKLLNNRETLSNPKYTNLLKLYGVKNNEN